jgi:transposase
MDVRKEVQKVWQSIRKKERRIVRSFSKGSPNDDLRIRCMVVINLVQGESPSLIARIVHCSRSQVYRVAGRWIEEGLAGLMDRREDNGEDKATEDYQATLLLVLKGSPRNHGYLRPTWTQELLIIVLEKKTGTRISRTTMSRLLRLLGIGRKRPKAIVRCPWSKWRKTRRLNQIQKLIDDLPGDEVVVYADEVDIHLNPKLGSDWTLPDMRRRVLTPGKNQKRYLAGALNAKTGRLTWVESDRKTSDLFIKQLWTLVKADYPDAKSIHIILDNYRIHSSKRTQIALDALKDKVQLHFLPPYCPNHNRIERLWKDLHDNVTRNHTCSTMKQLMKEVRKYLGRRKKAMKHEYINDELQRAPQSRTAA